MYSKVQETSYSTYTYSNSSNNSKQDTTSFDDMLNQAQSATKEDDKPKRKDSSESFRYQSMEEFFKLANEKGGILQFMQKENAEKIKALIEEKKAELKEQYGLNATPPLTGQALSDATKAVADALEDFKKELMKKLDYLDKSTKTS